MKLKQIAFLVAGLLPLGVMAQSNNPPAKTPSLPAPPNNLRILPSSPASTEMPEKGKLSYAVGMFFANNITNTIKRNELNVDYDTVFTAIKDVVDGKHTRLSEKEVSEVLNQLKVAMQSKMRAKDEEAKAKGELFLTQFAKTPGVTTLPNGLEYKVIKEGTGPKPKETDSVTVDYRGTLSDGTEFDRHDGFPTPIKGRIIQGWQKILPLMKVGSKWEVAIPSTLGYGPRGMPPKIPGNSVLVFELELKSITPGEPSFPMVSAASPGGPRSAPPAPPSTPVVSGEIIKVPSAEELKKGAKIEVIKAGQTNAVPQ